MRASHGWLARAGLATLALAAFLGSASPAFATDCAGLQAALTAAVAGDTVTVDAGSVCTGPFTLPNAAITVQGGGAGATLDGGGATPALSGIDIGATTIRNLTFRNGFSSSPGGAVSIAGNSAPTFDTTHFIANTSTATGGAL
ncbi:MAG: hypothetical protein QOH13_1444, partial [Thermoleophilaceae bacterium]|nr:hypothetical protein [Thermoleophilaceae bacterium]